MNQSAIIFKRNSKNTNFTNSHISIFKKKKTKYRQSLNSSFILEQPSIHNGFGEDKTLSKAYKNVINVITNILEKIESQKINGKTNNLNINSNSQRKRENEFLKKNSKKNLTIMENPKSMKSIQKSLKRINSKEKLSHSIMSNRSLNSIKTSYINNNNKNFNIPIINIIKPDKDEKTKQTLFNKSYNKITIDEINNPISSSTNEVRRNFPKYNDLLKINKKNMINHHSNKIIRNKIL